MSNVLDMNAFRARQRAQRRFCKDLAEAAEHKAMRPHKPATPTEAMRAAAQAAAEYSNQSPEGILEAIHRGRGPREPKQPGAPEGKLDLKKLAASFSEQPVDNVVDFGGARALASPAKLEAYLDGILDKAYNGSHWAQFRLALIQLADEAPGAAREQLQLAFPNMDPNQFEIWLDRATVEFDEYTDMLDNDHQP